MLKVETVANYFFLKLDQDSGDSITNLKIQKILYFAQGWHAAITGKKLFNDAMEAWVHGPVVPSLYHKYKVFGSNPIPTIEIKLTEKISSETAQILNYVWNAYGKYTPKYLEELTHKQAPWIEARQGKNANEKSNTEIKITSIKSYFTKEMASC